jgi:flagellar motor switch protein FliN/FliY
MVLDSEAHPDDDAGRAPAAEPDRAFEGFLDVPMQLRVELGRRRYRCAEVIAFHEGAIIALDRSAGDNVALLLNGNRIGAGEIVVFEDSMGLRITDLGVREAGKSA